MKGRSAGENGLFFVKIWEHAYNVGVAEFACGKGVVGNAPLQEYGILFDGFHTRVGASANGKYGFDNIFAYDAQGAIGSFGLIAHVCALGDGLGRLGR